MVDYARMDLADDARRAVGRQRIRDRPRRRAPSSRCLNGDDQSKIARLRQINDATRVDPYSESEVITHPIRRTLDMTITPATLVADIVNARPATIRVFQRHRIDFCCGGNVPLGDVCNRSGLDTQALARHLS